jgi:hypothetical protein
MLEVEIRNFEAESFFGTHPRVKDDPRNRAQRLAGGLEILPLLFRREHARAADRFFEQRDARGGIDERRPMIRCLGARGSPSPTRQVFYPQPLRARSGASPGPASLNSSTIPVVISSSHLPPK